MSGHSKWAKIKRAKGANDAKRGALFTKLAKNITVAAQEGGGDPDMNFTLRLAIDKAKEANMPQDNIERAVKRGTGELKDAEQVQRITYEFVTSFGISGLIDCTTDNTNRTFSEIKNMIESAGHKMGEAGSISWQFKEQGRIELGVAKLKKSEKYGEEDKYIPASLEDLEMEILDMEGLLDYTVIDPDVNDAIDEDDDRARDRKYVSIVCEKNVLAQASKKLKDSGWQIIDSEIIKTADNTVAVSDEDADKLENLVSDLLDHDDVDNVWTNDSEK
jgi:YebC/PmpR family DNA-binding regulatory protein